MTCIYNYKDYLDKRLAGQDVISAATLYGYNAMQMDSKSKKFIVLELNHDNYSYYEYIVDHNRFFINNHHNISLHNNGSVLTSKMLQDKAMLRWWNCVFYERDGKRFYDSYYDKLQIADNTNVTFKDAIKGFSSALPKMPLSNSGNQVFLAGDMAENPLLQYVLQSRLSKEISVLRCNETASYSESDRVILPEELERLKLKTNITMDLASMVNEPINITLPLDSSTMKLDSSTMKLDSSIKGKEMLPNTNIKWEDILNDKEHEDYRIKGTDLFFKTVKLHVECDVFQNIFLYCEDMSGNRKVIQVN